MVNWTELIRFCERIEKSGRPEQQYVAEGIRALMGLRSNEYMTEDGADEMKRAKKEFTEAAEACREEDRREVFPKNFPEKGYTMELADGSLWTVEDMFWRCSLKQKAPTDDDEITFTIQNVCYDFTAEDLENGEVRVRNEGCA